MEKNLKIIVIGIIILALIGLLIFVSFDISGPGSLIGGLAVLWAGVKSKVFGIKSSEERIESIKQEHKERREDWQKTKDEYDSKFRAIQAQMMYIDYKSALLSEKINNLDEYEKQKLDEINQSNNNEILQLLNERYK